MFTIEAIKATHAQVRSGSDFPQFIRDIKTMGVVTYTHTVRNGSVCYSGAGHSVSTEPKWELIPAKTGNAQLLKSALAIHQRGETDYPTFCREAARAGVGKWVVDLNKMTCIYYDPAGNVLLTEQIPGT